MLIHMLVDHELAAACGPPAAASRLQIEHLKVRIPFRSLLRYTVFIVTRTWSESNTTLSTKDVTASSNMIVPPVQSSHLTRLSVIHLPPRYHRDAILWRSFPLRKVNCMSIPARSIDVQVWG
jgi:hypothetical protein